MLNMCARGKKITSLSVSMAEYTGPNIVESFTKKKQREGQRPYLYSVFTNENTTHYSRYRQ